MRNWCRRMHLDSWKSPLDLLAGWHPCLREQEDAGLAHGGLTARDGQRYSKMYRLKRYRYAIFEKKIV